MEDLQNALAKLDVDGYSLRTQRAQRGGLEGTHLVVELEERGRRTRTIQDFVDAVESSGLSDRVIQQSRAIFVRIGEAEAKVHGVESGETHLH